MICIRCGQAEVAADSVFVVGLSDDPDLTRAIDTALRAQDIDGTNGLGQLCGSCWEVADAAIQAGARVHAAAHRDVVLERYEASLGRPLTPAERKEIDEYLGDPTEPHRMSTS